MDLINYMYNKHKINFNDQQKKAICHTQNPAIVLAVPGAGKTTVLITRTANLLINENVMPNKILSLTFSKASAIDMQLKFQNLFGDLYKNKVTFSTIHSFSFKIIREYSYRENIQFNLIEGTSSKPNKLDLLRQIYQKVNNAIITDDKLEELVSQISLIKNKNTSIESADVQGIKQFKSLFLSYENIKKQNNYIDFDDMLILALKILSTSHPVSEKFKKMYSYLQIDEAQDTSFIQHRIIDQLMTYHKNLFMVADDDQSIYGFRGASPKELLDFDKKYKDGLTYFMEENYRSTKDIIDLSNTLIHKNQVRYPKVIKTEKSNYKPVVNKIFKSDLLQTKYIVDAIENINSKDTISILSRSNLSLIPMANALMVSDLSFSMKDLKGNFFRHWVIQDLTAFILLSLNPLDFKAFEKIYYKMNAFISKKAIINIQNKCENKSIFDNLIQLDDIKSYQQDRFKTLKSKFNRLSNLKPLDAINFIEYDLEYRSYILEHCDKFGTSFDQISKYIGIFKNLASNQKSLNEFLIHLAHLKKKLSQKNIDSNIKLSTIHSSKGLEFDHVFLVDLIDGEFPTQSALDSYQRGIMTDIEEERRLFYVGMTRAKKELHLLSYSKLNNTKVLPSMFFNDLDILNITNDNTHLFSINQQVKHNIFNKGKIIDIQDDIMKVYFENYGVKKLSISLSLENNLIHSL